MASSNSSQSDHPWLASHQPQSTTCSTREKFFAFPPKMPGYFYNSFPLICHCAISNSTSCSFSYKEHLSAHTELIITWLSCLALRRGPDLCEIVGISSTMRVSVLGSHLCYFRWLHLLLEYLIMSASYL